MRTTTITFLIYIICFIGSFSISWAQVETPPQINAVLKNSFFCPNTEQPIVSSFTISNPRNVEIVELFIQISEGYVRNQDKLTLNGNSRNVTPSFSASEGKLTLSTSNSGTTAINDLEEAAKNVVFSSSNNVSGVKKFSFTINDKNYLPSTGHYYEYIPANRITWEDARDDAEKLNYYGLQGYLATITSLEEARLSGEQAPGQGWIGGSDAEKEGTWKWVTGPEAGKSFWIGGINGTTNGTDINPPFEYWSGGEPNDWPNPGIQGEENYLHVYDNGYWNDYPNSNSSITGYIVEYGGMSDDPEVDFGNNETTLKVAEISNPIGDERCGSREINLKANSSRRYGLYFETDTG